MAVDSFRLESFRPWNPFQDRTQPLQNSLELCQYPSPVSISATSPVSNSSRSASENPDGHSHKSERHPLPPRPPVEVCFNDSPPQETNTQHQPTEEAQTSCVSLGAEVFGLDDILQLNDLPNPGDEGHPSICDDPGPESQYRLGFESDDPGLACTASKHSDAGNTGSSGLAGKCCDATIDPAILDDYHVLDVEQNSPRRKETSHIVTPPHSDKSVRGHNIRMSSQMPKPLCQRSRVSKVAVVVDNSRIKKTCRTTQANRPVKTSFSVLRDQFSSLPIQERLEFLSWLFEGALSHCVSTRANADTASVSKRCISGHDVDMTYDCEHPGLSTELVDAQPTRKGLPWSMEENCLLVKLREEQNLSWSEVTRMFAQKFPGRSKGSLQVYWSTSLKKQRLSHLTITQPSADAWRFATL
ncbi:hypothetical protein N7462_005314 [Penicillium macrosclerotiorum]|uniref:uncharacterized protein n=1 Tax=Penicillium macrosclerotiorum TaxID=303699 RepID=UPI002548EB7B|nr:uncharacterized protein N7462_005314 [Penicillium macrosclerotiorum]KAJ5682149.1 hypothetical protein N7462_005314 [Penicillium macrosclerotiorum]